MRISGKTLLIVIVLAGICYWGFFLGGFDMLQPGGGDTVTLRVHTTCAATEAAFSPAGASIKVWDKATGAWLGSLSEDSTHDGKWDSAYAVPVGAIVVLKIEDSADTYYLNQVERMVTAPAAGVDRVSILDPIAMWPRSAIEASDIVGTLMTAGVEVDNSTNIASGETDIMISLTAPANKAWGGIDYHDYESGYDYVGGFMVFDLTTTTARATITGPIAYHWQIGAHEYWVIKIGQITNDGDVSGDGTWTTTVRFNNLVAAADALDIGLYTNSTVESLLATDFGTSCSGNWAAEAWLDIHLA
ncbi:MAG: hypothetical protein Q6361_04180 [Candidatus Hermodarchaeota archaeon]|nr:hypothetical protein [Candidatus Hermodarchaeota archaeon]